MDESNNICKDKIRQYCKDNLNGSNFNANKQLIQMARINEETFDNTYSYEEITNTIFERIKIVVELFTGKQVDPNPNMIKQMNEQRKKDFTQKLNELHQ